MTDDVASTIEEHHRAGGIFRRWLETLAEEKLRGITVPERGEHLRILAAELSRIMITLRTFSKLAVEFGGAFESASELCRRIDAALAKIFRDRPSGEYIVLGGVSGDCTPHVVDSIKEITAAVRKGAGEFRTRFLDDDALLKRTAGAGIVSKDFCVEHGITGICLRAAGVRRDLRKDAPYGAYERFVFEIARSSGEHGAPGDTWNRFMARIAEVERSADLVDEAIDLLPAGPIAAAAVDRPCASDSARAAIEGPMGEMTAVAACRDAAVTFEIDAPCVKVRAVIANPSLNLGALDVLSILG